MEIKIKMHSELDSTLKPDMELIFRAFAEMEKDPAKYDKKLLTKLKELVHEIDVLSYREAELAALIRTVKGEGQESLKEEKKTVTTTLNEKLENALETIVAMGGKENYKYTYDLHFNRIVAGLMGSTCYMKDTFKELEEKQVRNILTIAKTVEDNGHHSTFGHSHVTLELTGIPKALAMVLNNEKEYNTSEKSARYTIMEDLDPQENELFYKWKEIFERVIAEKYGDKQPFFDAKGTKIGKLAQENARYMISVFTPSNMLYTTSFRQLNYICHWFDEVIKSPNPNDFYAGIIPEMKEFVEWVKENGLYSVNLEDGKDRSLSLFGAPLLKQTMTSEVYSMGYKASFACLAQLQRHRTLDYRINDFAFNYYDKKFYIPPIIENDPILKGEWLRDIQSVADRLPQGMLLDIVERGTTENFLLKAKERVCVLAQKEIRDLTQGQCYQFAENLKEELEVLQTAAKYVEGVVVEGKEPVLSILEQHKRIAAMQRQFENLSKKSRCANGYKCASPCKFAEGVNLESLV